VLEKRANLMMDMSGGTSTQLLQRDIQSALADESVDSILLDVDSPGGSVDGTKAVADAIYEARGQKPIIAFANGMMASAAYWIGSAADEIIAEETAMVGSIGVALTHIDRSERDRQMGQTRTQIYAGKYKRIASDEKPLSGEGAAYLQGIVDTYYGIFVDAVSSNRGTTMDAVLDKMADGREFIGSQALRRVGGLDWQFRSGLGPRQGERKAANG
jgi:signal peptide peptidase SppA